MNLKRSLKRRRSQCSHPGSFTKIININSDNFPASILYGRVKVV